MENLTTAMDLGIVERKQLGKNEVDMEEASMVYDVDGSSKEVSMEVKEMMKVVNQQVGVIRETTLMCYRLVTYTTSHKMK